MSLINCPECGNECSTTAASCPHCGYAFVKPVAQPRVVVRQVEREDPFPKWVFIPLGILGAVVLFVIFAMLRSNNTADQSNVNVNLTTARQPERTSSATTTTTVPSTSQPSTVTVPTTSQPVSVSQTAQPPTTVTSVPSSSSSSTVTVPAPADKGSVVMDAKVLTKSGKPQSASKVKFYLLDKDLDSILSEAKIEDELGQGLVNAFGVSVVEPDKYREVNQKAYTAIKKHIVYSTTTDGTGKAQLQDVKPNNYYLFGVISTKNGFAIWNAPIYINIGQNALNLEPIAITEVVSSDDGTTEF